ncbi:recombinase family protein [Trueperella pyogenes]|uniref:recombinase family protein n=1 Tax=Trueperella pyogenes TaxID=1661 RepID=UPI00345D5546
MPTITTIPAKPRISGPQAPTMARRKVAAYARVSTDMEEQQSSYQAQVDYYTTYIQGRPEWEFVKVYADEGISGTSTKHREGFQNMVTDALAGRIDLILTKSVSRFARNTVDSLTTVRALKDAGVEVYFEKENIWTLDAKGELLITIMSSLAQEESRSISENVTWGHRRRFAQGKAIIPYASLLGYKKGEDGGLVIDENQAPTVRRIYQLFLDGHSLLEIKHILESEGHLTSRGNKTWASTTIRSILSNEKYRGDVLLQKTYVADFLTKQVKKNEGEVPQYYVEGHHEPIIEPRTWDQVQVELATRHSKGERKTGSSKTGLFGSRLKCADCGGWYGRKVWASNTKYKHTIWRCNHKYDGYNTCTTPALRDKQIQDAFLQALADLNQELGTTARMKHAITRAFDTRAPKAELKQLQTTIAALEEEFERLISDNQTRLQDQGAYLARFEETEATYKRALTKKDALEAEITQRSSRRATILTAYEELLSSGPVQHFEPRQFNALVNHAVVAAGVIRFIFKSGHEIEVAL